MREYYLYSVATYKQEIIMSLIQVPYATLIAGNPITSQVQQAFGDDGLGVILITNIPDFKEKKVALLKLAKKFGELPPSIQAKYEHPETFYAYGWSRGKEKMKGGKPDTAKGSYYANPICDVMGKDAAKVKKYPADYSPNSWPRAHVPTMEMHFKSLGQLMYDVGLHVLQACDQYLATLIDDYPPNHLHTLVARSKAAKGRLLHYYALPAQKNKEEDAACGWHLDHGVLTVLTKALYLDEHYEEVKELENCGLYIRNRQGTALQERIPENALLCQIGETLQLLSGGYLQATPHCVRSCSIPDVTRETFPVFMGCDVEQDITLPPWAKEDALETKGMKGLVGVPALKDRYKGCKIAYEFAHNTLSAYYS